MKASVPQRAQRKRRTDSGIVGQATTDEPIDTARSAVLCYEHARTCIVGRGTVSALLARFGPMPCFFLRSLTGAFATSASSNPGCLIRARPRTAMEAVNLRIHRSHSATATKENKDDNRYIAHRSIKLERAGSITYSTYEERQGSTPIARRRNCAFLAHHQH